MEGSTDGFDSGCFVGTAVGGFGFTGGDVGVDVGLKYGAGDGSDTTIVGSMVGVSLACWNMRNVPTPKNWPSAV